MCDYGQRLNEFSFCEGDCAGTPKAGPHTIARGPACNDSFTMTC